MSAVHYIQGDFFDKEYPAKSAMRYNIIFLIRRALAQGVSDHWPLDSNNEQHPFFAGLIQNWTILKTKINIEQKKQHRAEKINIEPQLLQLLLLLLLLLLKLFLVPGARGGCQGASGSGDRHPFLRRVTFFLHLFLGILRFLIFSYFVQNWSSNNSQNGVHL